MADETMNPDPFDASGAVKAAAEKTVDQARKAFDDAMDLARKTVADLEGNATTVQTHMRDMTRETLEFASASANATFSLMERMARAKDPAEVAALQKAYIDEQMERLGRQARAASDGAIRAAQDLTKPFET